VPYLSALEMNHDKALYKSTDTLLYRLQSPAGSRFASCGHLATSSKTSSINAPYRCQSKSFHNTLTRTASSDADQFAKIIPTCDLAEICEMCHTKCRLWRFCSVLFLSRPRSECWPHRGRTFSIYLWPQSCNKLLLLLLSSVILFHSSTDSPVHDLMLSIQAVRGLPRLRAPGIVLCIISFSRQFRCFLMVW